MRNSVRLQVPAVGPMRNEVVILQRTPQRRRNHHPLLRNVRSRQTLPLLNFLNAFLRSLPVYCFDVRRTARVLTMFVRTAVYQLPAVAVDDVHSIVHQWTNLYLTTDEIDICLLYWGCSQLRRVSIYRDALGLLGKRQGQQKVRTNNI